MWVDAICLEAVEIFELRLSWFEKKKTVLVNTIYDKKATQRFFN